MHKIALLLALATPAVFSAEPLFVCPANKTKGTPETQADCPWAGMARVMQAAPENQLLLPFFEQYSPNLLRQIKQDAQSGAMLALWGQSLNFDEGAKQIILAPRIYDTLADLLRTDRQKGRVVHAGTEHTYGYLFSNLDTSFGYKRARWVAGEINKGFGLTQNEISPAPAQGTLLANITYLAGRLALQDDKNCVAALAAVPAAPSLKNYNYDRLSSVCLQEIIKIGSRTVELRTDIVVFPNPQPGAQALLIYSVKDSAKKSAQLISAFPVTQDFLKRIANPANVGDGKKIKTRYNAYVEGITDTEFSGSVSLRKK